MNLRESSARGSASAYPFVVICGPSGSGKTTAVRALGELSRKVIPLVSHTTRKPRPGEIDGIDYHFVSEEEFKQHAFIEHTRVFGNLYGISRDNFEQRDACVVAEMTIDGWRAIRAAARQAISVFLLPPSPHELARRLASRHSEPARERAQRFAQARSDVGRWRDFDYAFFTDAPESSARRLDAIVNRQGGSFATTSLDHQRYIVRRLRAGGWLLGGAQAVSLGAEEREAVAS